jgi:ABC-type siderophore export system fused ATPase/permease subunit
MEYFPQIALGITIISAVWGHAIWLSGRFAGISKTMDERFEKVIFAITHKLENHEHHDNQRFAEVNNGLWELRLQTAVQDRIYKNKKAEDAKSGAGRSPGCL